MSQSTEDPSSRCQKDPLVGDNRPWKGAGSLENLLQVSFIYLGIFCYLLELAFVFPWMGEEKLV